MQTHSEPLIGLPMYPLRDDGRDSTSHMGGVRNYSERLAEAGGVPVFLPLCAARMVDTYLSRLSGVLLPGGGDIDPALFGEAPHPNLGVVQPERDSFELALCRAALQRGMPVLGICRGAQVLNVALGGTLIQDIPAETASPLNHRSNDETELRHEIDVEPGTLLARIIGEGRHPVNSQHHQSVRVPAPGLIVSAGSPKDGIIEAVEYRDARFVLGLQFHPECLPDLYLGIFREFVRACAGESQRV